MAKIKVDVKGKLKKWKKAKLQRLEENQKSKVDPWAFLQDADDEADDDTLDDGAPPALVPPDEEIGWQAQAGAQKIFLSCPLWEVLLHGNRGGGKTDALIVDFLQHVDVGWGAEWRGILFRETYPQLDDVRKKCRKLIPRIFPTATFNKNENTWSFPKGEQLLLRHMRVAEDYQGYHGHEYPWQGWEELCNWATPDCYKLMMSCSRSSVDPARRDKHGRPLPRKIRATTNPYGKGMNWVKRRFQLPHMSDKVILEEETFDGESGAMKEIRPRIAISASFKENLKLSKAEPNYMDNIKQAARNPAELAAWVSGSWDIQSGGMFDDLWESGVHVVQPFEIPSNWRINRSFDWGSSRPASVGWWAESDGTDVKLRDGTTRKTVRGDIFRIAEWYIAIPGQNKGLRLTPSQITEGILVREMAMGLRDKNTGVTRVGTGPADSAIWDTSGGPSIADQMKQPVRIDGRMFAGLVWEKADKSPGSRKNGCEAIRQRLKDAKKSEAGAREKPGLFIFNLCKDWIENVPILPRDDKDPDDVDTDSNDHQCFSAGTLVMTDIGAMRIEDMSAFNGHIRTRAGWESFKNARMTRRKAATVCVFFHSGVWVECTPDHKFMREDGAWVEASRAKGERIHRVLNSADEIVAVIPSVEQDVYCITVPDAGHFALAGGQIVSNCDETRYRIMTPRRITRYGRTEGI